MLVELVVSTRLARVRPISIEAPVTSDETRCMMPIV